MRILRAPARWLAFGFLGLIFSVAGATPDKSVDELLTQAGVSFAKGHREDAIELATKAVEAEPKNAKAYYVRGRFYAEVRQPQKALKDLNQALVLDPAAAPAYYHRGEESFKIGRIKESAAD